MLGSPGLDHLSNGSDMNMKYPASDCYSPKLFSHDPRDYKGNTNSKRLGREPWSSGYGRRLTF